MVKRQVEDRRHSIQQYVTETEFYGLTLPELKVRVDELLKKYGPKAFIDSKLNEYSDGQTQFVCVERPETDAEMRKRQLEELKRAKTHLTNIRKEYKHLRTVLGL